MKHTLSDVHKEHIRSIGVNLLVPDEIQVDEQEYKKHYRFWKTTLPLATSELIHKKVLANLAWMQHVKEQRKVDARKSNPIQIAIPEESKHKSEARLWKWIAIGLLLFLFSFFAPNAHAQFSRINYVNFQAQGVNIPGALFTYPFNVNCLSSLTCTVSGNTISIAASGGGGGTCTPPDTTSNAVLYDAGGGDCGDILKLTWNSSTDILTGVSGGTFDFSAITLFKLPSATRIPGTTHGVVIAEGSGTNYVVISPGNNGQILESAGAGADPAFQDPIVSGPDAPGAAQTKNPVAGLAGIDYGTGCGGSPCVQEAKVDSSGNVSVAVTGTTPISGTVTANQGTSPWVVSNGGTFAVQVSSALPAGTNVIGHVITDTGSTTAVTGTVTVSGTVTANAGTNLNTSLLELDTTGAALNLAQGSTTSGQTGPLIQTATTTAAPSYTTAKTNPLSTDTAGNLRVAVTSAPSTAVTQGTSPWVVGQGTAANLNATVVGTGTFGVQAAQSGTWNITNISGTVSLPTNAAQETGGNLATLAGGVTGSVYQENLKQVNGVTTLANAGAVGTGAQRVAVGQDVTTIAGSAPGTAGTASANVVTVQGIASMTPLLVTPAANSAINLAQVNGHTTVEAGQNGSQTVGGAVATNTVVSSATNPLLIAGSDYAGTPKIQSLKVTSAGTGQIDVVDALPAGANVIGHVITDSGSTTAVTGNVTAVQGTGSNLHMVCDSGCTPGGSFADNAAFTAGTTAVNISGGWYSTSPSACTDGSACSPSLTSDRKTFVQSFQGTSPWVGNTSQVGGTNIDTNSGNKSAGTQRIVIATDQPAIASMGGGTTGSAVPTGAQYAAGNGSGNLTGITICDNSSAVNMSSSTTTQIIAISGSGGRTYICSINLVVGAADNVALISGSGSNCASNQAGLAGGTSAATGWNFAANGGLTLGSGLGMIFKSATTNNEICLITSSAAQVSGSIAWTQY